MMVKFTKLLVLFFSLGFLAATGQNLPQDLSTYDKSKHIIKRTSEIPFEKMEKECAFFGGDSLAGFNLSSAIKETAPSYSIYREFRNALFRKEAEYVKKKYNIAQFPYEITENQKVTAPPNQVMVACSNVDFESGSFAGWTGKVGYNALSTNNITVTSTGINTAGIDASYRSCSYHTLTTTASGNDFYGNFPAHYPGGGTYSVRLGGENANVYDGQDCNYPTVPYNCHSPAPGPQTYCGGERLEQTFTVSASNSLFTFSYAAVLNDGGHTAGHQPYFKIEVLDPSNNAISCFTQRVELVAGVVPPGGVLSSNGNCWFLPHVSNDDIVYYIPWKTNSYNLSGYIGQNLTVRFTAAGCTEGDHFGYAYFDASCGPAAITTSNASPCAGQNVTLTAPSTLANVYSWAGPAGGIIGASNGQSITAGAAGTYTVTVGTGLCAYTLTIPVTYGSLPGLTASATSSAICNGGTTTLNASAATSYTWTPAGSLSNPNVQNPVATPTTTTIYTLTASSGGCSGTTTTTVTVNQPPTLSLTPAASSICIGNNTSITAGGATTYTWTPSGSLSSANGSPVTATPTVTTTYTLNATDGNGCTNNKTVTIVVNPLPTLTVTPTSSVLCSGTSTNISAAGASTYTWTPSGSLSSANGSPVTASPTSPTTYTINGTNSNGCQGSTTVFIDVNTAPTLTLTPAASGICVGNSTSISAAGASTYTWTPSGSLSSANGSPVTATPSGTTTYTVTGTALNGCTSTNMVTVNVNPLPTLTVTPVSSAVCSGGSTSISASGATTYTWTPAATLSSANGSPVTATPSGATTYTVTGTNNNGCVNSQTVSIGINALPTLTVTPAASAVCTGSSTTVSASGATTYTWTPAATLSSANGSPVTATPTGATTYTVTGTDNNGCQNSNTVTLNVNSLPNIIASAADPAICNGNGTMLSASGASTYTWTPAGSLGNTAGSPVAAAPTTTTTYTVTGTDNNGCVNTQTVTLTINQPPVLTAVGNQTVCSGTAVNTITFSTTPAGGNINWSNDNVNIGLAASGNGDINAYTPTVTAQQTGVITATPVDAVTACPGAPQTFTITVNPLPSVDTTSMVITGAACGQSSGCISGIAGQAPGTYQYSWDNGTTWTATSQNCSQPAGSYSLEVQDMSTGCITNGTYAISNLNGPGAPVVLGATTTCAGDSVNLSVSPQNNITYTWTDAAGTTTGTTHTVYNIGPSGTYTVSVLASDTNGCTNSTTTSITVNALPSPTVSGTTHFCTGSNTVLNANPGTGNYNYQWSQNGTPVTGATGATFTATAAGNYSVDITDNSTTCNAASSNTTVTVDALPVIDTTTTMTITPSNCNQSTGTIINVNVTPNSSNNTYSWTDGNGNVVGTSLNLNGVPAGNYCLSVTDSNGCNSNICGMTVDNAGAPGAPTLATPNNTYCQGQTVNPVSVSGTGTFTWYSDVNLTTQVATGTTYTPTVAGTTTYYVTATDSGCTGPATPVTITINNNPATPLVANPATAYCQNQTAGTITATGTGTILWSTSPTMSPVVNTGNSLTPGTLPVGTTTYYLVDSSAAGCKSPAATASITINPSPADPTVSAPAASYCQGDVIQPVTASGASTILWYTDPGHMQLVDTGATYTPAGTIGTTTYYLVDSSAAGCLSAGATTVAITVNPVPATPGVSAASAGYCQGQPVSNITATGTGTILWSTSPTMTPVMNTGNTLTPGTLPVGTTTYYLIDSSAAGCKSLVPAMTTVNINPSPTINGNPTIDSAFCGLNTGNILNLNVSGGTPQYTYQWVNTAGATVGTALNLQNVAAGTYSLIVVDANQCSDTSNTGYTVYGTSAVNAAFTPSTLQGSPTLNVTYTNGSTGATSYAWDLGDGSYSTQMNPQASYTTSGTYSVVLIASNGHCTDTASVMITVDVPPRIVIPNVFTPNGDGTNDGFFIDSEGIRTLRCDIYNRWGQLVYTLYAPNDIWNGIMINGNAASDGTYYYILDAVGFDNQEIKAEGHILLTR